MYPQRYENGQVKPSSKQGVLFRIFFSCSPVDAPGYELFVKLHISLEEVRNIFNASASACVVLLTVHIR